MSRKKQTDRKTDKQAENILRSIYTKPCILCIWNFLKDFNKRGEYGINQSCKLKERGKKKREKKSDGFL